MQEQVKKYFDIILAARKQIIGAEKMIKEIQLKCPHKNLEHFRQDYVGSWSNCKDCGKEEV
jgi:hypothetical protein